METQVIRPDEPEAFWPFARYRAPGAAGDPRAQCLDASAPETGPLGLR